MSYLVDIETSFPKYYYSQKEISSEMCKAWSGKIKNLNRVRTIYENVDVSGRHLSAPLNQYFSFDNFDQKNECFIKTAVDILEVAVTNLLNKYQLAPENISALWSNTVTGFSIPSLEARLMNRIEFCASTKRIPIMGLGCMAGVAGINRVADYLKAYPEEAVLFLSVELCTLTLQLNDFSVANLIATGLFGDGAAAVLMVGENHPLASKAVLKWEASRSHFIRESEDVMGWHVGQEGLKVILSKSVPKVVSQDMVKPLQKFLDENSISLKQIETFLAHPGGPKVLSALESSLGLAQEGLKHSRDSLRANGNMSSVSVLDIIKRHILEYQNGDKGLWKNKKSLSLAMGPAFSIEMGLLQWQ